MRRLGRAALRPLPAAAALAAIERAVPPAAWLARRARVPASAARFPEQVRPLLGDVAPEARAPLVAARLRFLMVRAFLDQFLAARQSDEASRALEPIVVDGAEHVARAAAERRGALLATAHFGLPPLLKVALEARGYPVIGVGGRRAAAAVVVGRDVFLAARGAQQMREALEAGRVCVVLVDVPRGRYSERPFLAGRIPVAPGAFRLAQVTSAALLPAFAVCEPRLAVEIGPPIEVPPGDRAFDAPIARFIARYEAAARRTPSHLLGYEPVFPR